MSMSAKKAAVGISALTIVTASVGGVVLLGTATQAAASGVAALKAGDEYASVAVAGVSDISVDASEANLSVVFGDVTQAELETRGVEARGWTFEVDGGELTVASPDRLWNWFNAGWWDGGTEAVLTLPESLRGADLDLTLSAGSLSADGDFGETSVDVSAGSATVTGSATALEVDVSSGNARVDVEGVSEASYTLSAGWIDSTLTGSPDVVAVDVSAGSLTLTLPDRPYQVMSDVSAGSLENGLQVSPTAPRSVTVALSAGSIDLRAGG